MQKTDGAEHCKIKCIMFDMDNTLFDLVEAKIASCSAIVEHLGVGNAEELLMYFLRPDHGFENPENIRDYLRDMNIHEETVFENCCRIYTDTKLGTIQLYPYVMETLELLKAHHRLFIVTDANYSNALSRLEKLELKDFFDNIITSDMTETAKPDLKVFYHALSIAGLQAEEVLFVGDSLHRDIEPANKVGMVTAHAFYGDRNLNESNNTRTDYILNNIRDIFNVKGIGKNLV